MKGSVSTSALAFKYKRGELLHWSSLEICFWYGFRVHGNDLLHIHMHMLELI